jgi:predicted alpha/beta-fold hydrolase
MWEALAHSRRQDRVLHGAAKALNVVAGAAMIPLWVGGQRATGWLDRTLARRARPPELPVPPAGPRDLDGVVAELKSLPRRIHRSPSATARKGIADLSMFTLAQKRQTVNFGYAYPRQFEYHYFEGADGERIAATVATHSTPRPGLVVVHGLLTTRLFDYVREIAVRAYYEWGFNVAAIDLRSFGLTEMLTRAPSSAGWKEGEDIVCAGRYLKELGSTSVGAIGISLGACSVMNACHLAEAPEQLDGGILAISGPADTRVATEYIDRPVPRGHPFYPVSRFFHTALIAKVRNLGWPAEVASFQRLTELVVAPHYGITVAELYERSSPRNHIASAQVPVLVLHAEDDEVVPVEHARMLERAAGDSELVRVWILPGGGHAAFDAIDRRWTYQVYRTYFERLARYASSDYARADAAGSAGVGEPVAERELVSRRRAEPTPAGDAA